MAKQNTREALEATKEADRIFLEKEQMKAQQLKEDARQLQVFNIRETVKREPKNKRNWFVACHAPCSLKTEKSCLTVCFCRQAEKSTRRQQLKREEKDFEEKTAELIAEEENQFQQYSQQVIKAASEARQNLFPLFKAAREGFRGGLNPQMCLVQDQTGAQTAHYVSGVTQELSKALSIETQKRRLGFTL